MIDAHWRVAVSSRAVPDVGRSHGPGFSKATIDRRLFAAVLEHFRSNVCKFVPEAANSYLLTNADRFYPSLLYQDDPFNHWLLDELHQEHERWSGGPLKQAACYGIRVYQSESYLRTHVDRSTHVVSSTLCVDCRLRSRWPFYIEDAEGHPHEISIEPGEMLFFAGTLLPHGRPYPLDGEYYASIFLHYTPVDAPAPGNDGPEN
jgi:hypothetical protein